MRDAHVPGSTPCTARSDEGGSGSLGSSENLEAAYLESPVGGGFRAELKRARKLTRANALRKAARVAVAASALLAGRPDRGVS